MKVIVELFCIAIAICTVCSGCAKYSQKTEENLSGSSAILTIDPKVKTGQLPNGFRYVIRPNKKPENRSELRLVVDVGSVQEEDNQQGLAHFVEHMAFNGTENFEKQELVDYLELVGMRFGPDLNAYTSFDETVYMLQIPMDSTHVVETAMQILFDWAQGIKFESEEIDKERGVVVEEWRLGQGASRRIFDQQLPIILRGSRYADRLPIGQKVVLDTFSHGTLKDFYRTWYRPELMSFIAVGDFEISYMESLAIKYFSHIPVSDNGAERVYFPVPNHDETLFAIATDIEATSNVINIYTKKEVDEQSSVLAYRKSIVERLYHHMLNERLEELTKRSNPPFLGAGSSKGRLLRTKEFISLGAVVSNNGFERGVEALSTESERIRQHGFTTSELSRAKKLLLRGVERAYRERDKLPSSTLASEYVRHVLIDEPIPGIEQEYLMYNQLLPGISLHEVNELASEWNTQENRVVTISAPFRKDVLVPSKEDLKAIFNRTFGEPLKPYTDNFSNAPLVENLRSPGRVVKNDSIPEIGVRIWTLSNGVRVQLKKTDFKNDEILFTAFSPGGHSLVENEHYISAATATSIIREGGVGGFDNVQLQKKLSGKVVSVSPILGTHQEGFVGSASPEDLETMFELIYAYSTVPRIDTTAFLAFKDRMVGSIQNRDMRPETSFSDTIQITMASGHFRARPWSLEILNEMDLNEAFTIYRERFEDMGDFVFSFVGNLDFVEMEEMVSTYLANLPVTGREETWRDIGVSVPNNVVEKYVYAGIEPKSSNQIIFTGDFDYGWENNFFVEALSACFEIKLRELLREDLGGTYNVSVRSSVERFPKGQYRISISFSCDPARESELTEIVFHQIELLRQNGIEQVYIEKVKEIRRRSHELALRENGFWLNILQDMQQSSISPNQILNYNYLISRLNSEEVLKAANQYFNRDQYARFVLFPIDYYHELEE
jgi:zinc protease